MSLASSLPRVASLASALALLLGCGESGSRALSETGINSIGGDDNGGDEDTGTAGEDDGNDDNDPSGGDGDGDEGDGVKFDLGPPPASADLPMDEGCQKVDLLFVIDNSGSMQNEQASLVASFGGFVAGIQAALDTADSYHVGVVTTDSYGSNADGCKSLGALVTRTGGEASSGTNCLPFSSGMRYLDDTEPDLATKFACIAQVGISGSGDEIQAEAGYRAISPNLNGPGACNEGFVREDALLVVVIITDEDDEEDCNIFFGCDGGSNGDPADWFQQFTNYKGGIEENIVLLSLVGGPNNGCGADNCSRLINMTNMFTNGSVGDICAPSYETFFNQAIAVIDDACDNFTPPG